MSKQKFDINKLRVAAPCSVGWEMMSGDERVRRCHSCELNIYNVSEMTKTEVENLIANREGRLCIRLYKRADGTILTKDCPVGIRAYQKRVARFAGATLAAILGLFSVSFAQKKDKNPVDASKTKIIRTVSQKNILSGTIYDKQGAVIPEVEIKIYRKNDKEIFKTISDGDGNYKFESFPSGIYTFETKSNAGFENYKIINLKINSDEKIQIDVTLKINKAITVGIFLEEPSIDTTSSGVTTKIAREMIDKLPH
ncbi:MAG: carboxypeptidase-like regulatory domain-containing protein [Pyrinomonadaceae bacterium]